MTTVLLTLLAVVAVLAVVLIIERRMSRRTESPVRGRHGPVTDSAT